MTNIQIFETCVNQYEEWFEQNPAIFALELSAVKELIPTGMTGIEIGVGTGRFAAALGIQVGVEPSEKMAEKALQKGLTVIRGRAENLPVENNSYDFVLMVTTICFLEDIFKSFMEIRRILKKNGVLIIGFIDKNSKLGCLYEEKKQSGGFYKDARFFSVEEVLRFLTETGFKDFQFRQVLSAVNPISNESVKTGYGQGGFVVIQARQ